MEVVQFGLSTDRREPLGFRRRNRALVLVDNYFLPRVNQIRTICVDLESLIYLFSCFFPHFDSKRLAGQELFHLLGNRTYIARLSQEAVYAVFYQFRKCGTALD